MPLDRKLLIIILCSVLSGFGQGDIYAQEENGAAWYEKGRSYLKAAAYDSAIYCFRFSADLSQSKKDTLDYFKAKEGVARSYQNSNQIKNAEKEYLDLINELIETSGEENAQVGKLYNRLGNLYVKSFDVERGLIFLNKSRLVREKLYGNVSSQVARAHINLALAHETYGAYEKAESHNLLALEIAQNVSPIDYKRIGICYNNLGDLYEDMGDIKKAIEYGEKAVSTFENQYTGRNQKDYVLEAKSSLANHLFANNETEAALDLYERLIPYCIQSWGSDDRRVAQLSIMIGDCYSKLDSDENALKFYQEAIFSLFATLDSSRLMPNPNPEDFEAEPWAMVAIEKKAHCLFRLYEKEKLSPLLNASFETYKVVDAYVDFLRKNIESQGSKFNLAEEAKKIYEVAIRVCHELNKFEKDETYLDWGLRFAEKTKAIILLESMASSEAKRKVSIPQEIKEEEKQLSLKIIELESQDSTSRHKELIDLRIEHRRLLDKIKREYPEYYALGYEIETVSIPAIRELLESREATFVEYFWGSEELFMFVINRDTSLLITQTLEGELSKELGLLIENINQSPQTSEEVKTNYQKLVSSGHRLYQRLVQPWEANLSAGEVGNLLIVPDGVLNYLPFEVLLKTPAIPEAMDFKELDYLVYHYQMQYAYSANLLAQQSENNTETKKKACLAWGVDFAHLEQGNELSDRYEMSALTYVPKELAAIDGSVTAELFINERATKTRFIELAPEYQILHLATHAFVDDDNPAHSMLAMYGAEQSEENFIKAQELKDLNISADLAVLSACRTGDGELRNGEGVMSLARSFIEAGCKSIVMSLWSVNDASTAFIMGNFYSELSEGRSKDAALREAKISYLKSNSNMQCHPYYWAAFVPIGNARALEFSSFNFFHWFLLIGGMMVFVLILYGLVFTKLRSAK